MFARINHLPTVLSMREGYSPPPLALSYSVVNGESLKTLLALICFLSTFSLHALPLSQQHNYNCPPLWFLLPHFPPIHHSRFLPLLSLLRTASLPSSFHSISLFVFFDHRLKARNPEKEMFEPRLQRTINQTSVFIFQRRATVFLVNSVLRIHKQQPGRLKTAYCHFCFVTGSPLTAPLQSAEPP